MVALLREADARQYGEDYAPQPGPQTLFSRLNCRIAIYGGQAGGGKTNALVSNAARYVHRPHYVPLLFRRERVQVYNPGGLWDEAASVYPRMGGREVRNLHRWVFPSGSKITMSHMESKTDHENYDGAQSSYIGFDELQNFEDYQFFYMLSRNRNTHGFPNIIRASCNPRPDSWLSRLLQWWWDPETGYPLMERGGVIRWVARIGDDLHWDDNPLALIRKFAPEYVNRPNDPRNPVGPVSFTFIPSTVYDNKKLLEAEDGRGMDYLNGLRLLARVEQERLLKGNWKITASAGDYFPKHAAELVPAAPGSAPRVRCWDQAATKPSAGNADPDWTVGVRMAKHFGLWFVDDVVRLRENPAKVNEAILNTAAMDGPACQIALFQDPGAAGKALFASQTAMLAGYAVRKLSTTSDKVTLALPASSQWLAGNIKVVQAPWNDAYLRVMNNFGSGIGHDDDVDATAGAFQVSKTLNIGSLALSF